MVTYFNKKDLVKFGKYLLSDGRIARIKRTHKADNKEENLKGLTLKEKLREVYDSDIENWKLTLKQKH